MSSSNSPQAARRLAAEELNSVDLDSPKPPKSASVLLEQIFDILIRCHEVPKEQFLKYCLTVLRFVGLAPLLMSN